MKKIVLGIKIDDISINQAAEIVNGWLIGKGKHYIVTPNPEIVVMAQKDKDLKRAINSADLAVPDGVGLRLSGDIVNYTPGVDLMERLILMAQEKGFTVGLLGGEKGIAEEVAKRLQSRYPNLEISFASGAIEVNEDGREIESRIKNHESRKRKTIIRNSKFMIQTSDILFVALGPPKQEKWIVKNLDKLDVKVVMGVGGSFDFISGKVIRAPKSVRSLGLEWLFRLILQPWRLKRQTALLKFIWLLTRNKQNMLS